MKGQQFARMGTIAKILTEEGFGYVLERLGWTGKIDEKLQEEAAQSQADEASAPARLRRVLERLGPLFVKFGQILSTRQDLLPTEYCEAFAQLQSKVPPFDSAVAREIIEEELGKPIEDVFDEFNETPLASASLAQVHTAHLKSGEDVVLKVQRPEATDQIKGDTDALLWLSRQLDRFLPIYKAHRIHSMAENFAKASLIELNFLHEASTAERFRENFEDEDDVYVPKMYPEYSTGKLLVIERIYGHQLDSFEHRDEIEAAGFKVDEIVQRLLKIYVTQAYVHGLIHADLHPGNVFLMENGKIAMIDFGLYAELSRSMQNALFRTVLYRSNFKHELVADSMLEMMEPAHNADPASFRKAVIELSKRGEQASIIDFSIATSLQEEAKIAAECGYIAPNELMLLVRALVTVEGIAVKFTPEINITKTIQPIMREITLKRFDLERIAKDGLLVLPDILEMIELAPSFHRNLLKVERAFARSASLSEFVAGQLLGQHTDQPKPRPKGSFGAYLLAVVLWILGGYFLAQQPGSVSTIGELSLPSALFLALALFATMAAWQKR